MQLFSLSPTKAKHLGSRSSVLQMALPWTLFQLRAPVLNHPNLTPTKCSGATHTPSPVPSPQPEMPSTRRCLRCNTLYQPEHNSPTACFFHGHTTGEKGLFSLSPPHQGVDGEWTDESGVIVYKWNEKGNRPNTGRPNWKSRWSCCSEYDENAPPCRRGWHVSYDDGFTLF